MKLTRRRVLFVALALLAVLAAFILRRRAGESLTAIPARGGESLALAPLATAHYLQGDPRWENETVGGSGERLGQVGCTVCSLAMALDHYGVQTTPKELNDFLKANAGYNLRGWLRWDTISKFAGGKVSMDYIGPPDFARMDGALKNRQPVIAKIYIDGIIPHWVLIVGKETDEYLIRDPLGDGKSVVRLSTYESRIYAIRTLKRPG